ncbi:hypothetical protein WJX84_006222 [Apatococcus fuscideae]|uniref:Uncharacterized protein n=1 Tax=Apatococcus fuscideae TaxID=2026836 RepID=A0AAW1T6L8_9CHLO
MPSQSLEQISVPRQYSLLNGRTQLSRGYMTQGSQSQQEWPLRGLSARDARDTWRAELGANGTGCRTRQPLVGWPRQRCRGLLPLESRMMYQLPASI